MKIYDCLVVGGGAAGLMCAAIAGSKGLRVAVIDHANKVGKKILMSGGGRCNFTNYFVEPANFVSSNPHFCKSALSRYTPYDFITLVEKYNLEYHEKTLGQLFCDNKAKDILNILLSECEQSHVDIYTHTSITAVKFEGADLTNKSSYTLETSQGIFGSSALVVASGGLSIPTMGATGFGYDIAKQFGLSVTSKHAALVPFTLKQSRLTLSQELSGVSLPVSVSCNNQQFLESILFTHKGLSGPAILQISTYWYFGDSIKINFLPNINLAEALSRAKNKAVKISLRNFLAQYMPKRFVDVWLIYLAGLEGGSGTNLNGLTETRLAELSQKNIDYLHLSFHEWEFVPSGTEGYRTAEVTRGGVNTDGVSSKTFEAKKQPDLYFIGEVLDVTGWLGGFNFQWAWASGYCAAQSIADKAMLDS